MAMVRLFYLERYGRSILVSNLVDREEAERHSHPHRLSLPQRGYTFMNIRAAKVDMRRMRIKEIDD